MPRVSSSIRIGEPVAVASVTARSAASSASRLRTRRSRLSALYRCEAARLTVTTSGCASGSPWSCCRTRSVAARSAGSTPAEAVARSASPVAFTGESYGPGGTMFAMGGRRLQVVAHRGSSATKAEHTLGAYIAALDEGADALECDVRLTADGHLVCVHDRNLLRTAQQRRLVSSMELAELEQLDFAAWKHPWAELDDEAPDVDKDLDKVLTLRRLLETVAGYARPVQLAIETKHPTRYAGLVERRLVELLADFGWAGSRSPARVMSFSWVALRRVSRLAPLLELVYLVEAPLAWASSRPFAEPDWIAGPGIELLQKHPDMVRRIHGAGTRVHVWTVNTRAELELCRELGVDAVITDQPGVILDYLRG